MSQINFEWKVVSVDDALGTMVVYYKVDEIDEGIELNIPKPVAGATEDEVHSHIGKFIPKQLLAAANTAFADIAVGSSGRSSVTMVDETNETPNIVGSWNEEYIRAMVYLVLEEIRESEA